MNDRALPWALLGVVNLTLGAHLQAEGNLNCVWPYMGAFFACVNSIFWAVYQLKDRDK